jgi:protein-disulfide isomerase
VLDQYPEKVKLVFKNLPLTSHKFAKKAALAALAANEQDQFWSFHAKLFTEYKTINDDKIIDFAREIGLDIETFEKDRISQRLQNLVARDINEAKRLGVRGIPTIFVNGRLVKRRTIVDFRQMIDEELQKMK